MLHVSIFLKCAKLKLHHFRLFICFQDLTQLIIFYYKNKRITSQQRIDRYAALLRIWFYKYLFQNNFLTKLSRSTIINQRTIKVSVMFCKCV
jgi:hypothetical protein